MAFRFNEDGVFRILHLTDIHMHALYDESQRMTEQLIRRMVVSQSPDLCVITGDIASAGSPDRVLYSVNKLMTMFDWLGIPVAITLGNHDSQGGRIERKALLREYMKHSCCIASDNADLPGAGSYNIPVLASSGDRVVFNLWMIDSGEDDGMGHYASTDPKIIEWYADRSSQLRSENGGTPVPSLVFQHIIVPEIYSALKRVGKRCAGAAEHIYNKGEYYVLNPDNTNSGRLLESPCCGYVNNGQFDAQLEQGDVLAMFFGHDHMNNFSVNYKGIDLVATPKARFGETDDCMKGGRIVTLMEDRPQSYETRLLRFGSMISLSDVFHAEKFEKDTLKKLYFRSRLYMPADRIYTSLAGLLTGKKLDFSRQKT